MFVMSWDGINPVYMFKVGCALYYFMAELGLNSISVVYYRLLSNASMLKLLSIYRNSA